MSTYCTNIMKSRPYKSLLITYIINFRRYIVDKVFLNIYKIPVGISIKLYNIFMYVWYIIFHKIIAFNYRNISTYSFLFYEIFRIHGTSPKRRLTLYS